MNSLFISEQRGERWTACWSWIRVYRWNGRSKPTSTEQRQERASVRAPIFTSTALNQGPQPPTRQERLRNVWRNVCLLPLRWGEVEILLASICRGQECHLSYKAQDTPTRKECSVSDANSGAVENPLSILSSLVFSFGQSRSGQLRYFCVMAKAYATLLHEMQYKDFPTVLFSCFYVTFFCMRRLLLQGSQY